MSASASTQFAQPAIHESARVAVAARIARSIARSILLVGLLLAASVDGHIRLAFGLLHKGHEGAVWTHRWCRRILRCLGIRYAVEGDLPGHLSASHTGFEAVVCNHLSYLDILLMGAAHPFMMVAKTEVRSWPLLGWMTTQSGTVYVQRGGHPATYPGVNAAMAHAFRSGLPVLFFPEGTTTDGSEVLSFRRGLFHSVLRDNVQVQTAALRYELSCDEAGATVANDVCWWGEALLAPHLFRLLGLHKLHATVRFGKVVEGADRFVLSQNAHASVTDIYTNLTRELYSDAAVVATETDRRGQKTELVEAL